MGLDDEYYLNIILKLTQLYLLCESSSPDKKYRPVMNSVRTVFAKCDSAASAHYWRDIDMNVLSNIKPYLGASVTLPDNTKINPAKQGLVPINKKFSKMARTATNLPELKSASLLAVAPLCDDGKLVVFDDKEVIALEKTKELHSLLKKQPVLL